MKLFKNRKQTLLLLSVMLLLCLAVGLTYSGLGGITSTKNNVFTPLKEIRARLDEPNWDKNEGLKLVPGKTLRKDPMISNTCTIDEYVAMRLTFRRDDGSVISDADLTELLGLLEIDWHADWVLCAGSLSADAAEQPLIFYFNKVLEPGQTTSPLFSTVQIKDQADGLTEAELRWLQGIKFANGEIEPDPNGIGKFNIKIEGAAVQREGFATAADAVNTLKALFP